MIIGAGSNFLEIVMSERRPSGAPDAGDLHVGVAASYEGFAGRYDDVWIFSADFENFLASKTFEEFSTGENQLGVDAADGVVAGL